VILTRASWTGKAKHVRWNLRDRFVSASVLAQEDDKCGGIDKYDNSGALTSVTFAVALKSRRMMRSDRRDCQGKSCSSLLSAQAPLETAFCARPPVTRAKTSPSP
jgi:hypothetical protein